MRWNWRRECCKCCKQSKAKQSTAKAIANIYKSQTSRFHLANVNGDHSFGLSMTHTHTYSDTHSHTQSVGNATEMWTLWGEGDSAAAFNLRPFGKWKSFAICHLLFACVFYFFFTYLFCILYFVMFCVSLVPFALLPSAAISTHTHTVTSLLGAALCHAPLYALDSLSSHGRERERICVCTCVNVWMSDW